MESEVRIERVLPTSPAAVYAAWSQAELMERWYCPNPAMELTVGSDAVEGGDYVVRMGPHVLRGQYLELDPPYLLAFSWKWDGDDAEPSRVRVELAEAPEGTRLLLTHSGFDGADDAANHLQAWEPQLDRLAELVTDR